MTTHVDVSRHYSPSGKLYYPSKPWGLDMFVQGMSPDNNPDGPLATDSASNKSDAYEKAQRHCLKKVGNSCTVFRRRDGRVDVRYWNDGQLHFIRF